METARGALASRGGDHSLCIQIGGFLAVSWTTPYRATLMIFALLIRRYS